MPHVRSATLAYPPPERLAIEHSQANPLRLSLAWDADSEMPSSLTLRAEIHPSRSVANTAVPLAAVTLAVTSADVQPWTLEFSSQQTNLDLLGKDRRDFVLTITGIESSTRLYTLADADLTLLRHPCSQLVPAAVSPLLYATTDDLDALDARVTDLEENGGGGGATNLTRTLAPTSVTIVSDTGTDAVIPAADGTNAGVFPAALHTKLTDLPTAAALTTSLNGKSNTGHGHGAGEITGLGALATRGTVAATHIDDLAVVTAKLADAAVATAKIADAAVATAKIADAAVATAKIADAAVTTAKINNAAVTNAKLANANAATIKSNLGGSSATPQDNSVEDVAAALPVFGSAQRGLVPAFGAGTNGRFVTPVGWGNTLAFGTLTAADPIVITQTWNNGAIVFAGLEMTITQTAANASSYFLRFRGGAAGATDRYTLLIDGTTTQAGGANWIGGACGLSSGAGFFLNDSAARIQLGSSAGSPNIHRDSDGGCGLRNGISQQVFRVYDTFGSATDYHRTAYATARASLASLSGSSVTAAALIPAGAIVVGVTAKVLTAITGATSWQLGTAADPDRFAASGGIALGSTTDSRNWTSGAMECFLTATDIILTANGANFTAGSVYIAVHYIRGESD